MAGDALCGVAPRRSIQLIEQSLIACLTGPAYASCSFASVSHAHTVRCTLQQFDPDRLLHRANEVDVAGAIIFVPGHPATTSLVRPRCPARTCVRTSPIRADLACAPSGRPRHAFGEGTFDRIVAVGRGRDSLFRGVSGEYIFAVDFLLKLIRRRISLLQVSRPI